MYVFTLLLELNDLSGVAVDTGMVRRMVRIRAFSYIFHTCFEGHDFIFQRNSIVAEIMAFRLLKKKKITEIPVKPGLHGLKVGYATEFN